MTLLLEDKNPPRYACERCACEVGCGPHPLQTLATPDGGMHRIYGDDDPIALDLDCDCTCHDVWRLYTGNRNARLRARLEEERQRPPKPRSEIPTLGEAPAPKDDDLW